MTSRNNRPGWQRACRLRAVAACVLALGHVALAQPAPESPSAPPPLPLEEVLASVREHYPMLQAARGDLAAAEAESLAARGAFDPEVRARGQSIPFGPYPYTRFDATVQQPLELWGANVFGGWRWGGGDIPAYYGNLQTNALGELRAGVSVPLWRNNAIDRRRANLERTGLGEKAASLAIFQSLLEASRTAAQRYWDWVAAGRRLEIARSLLEIALTRDKLLAERVRRGDLPQFERKDNERALLQRQAQVVSAQRVLQQAAIELSLFLRDAEGLPVIPAEQRLPPRLPELPATEVLASSLNNLADVLERRPDVRRLELQRDQQRVEARFVQNQQRPLIDVSVAALKDLGGGSERLGRPELELGITVEIPTFNRAAEGRVRATEAGLSRVDAQLQLQRDRAQADVRDAVSALEAARARVALARKELDVAQELARGERTRFTQGDSSLLFVNLREQTAAEAAVREVDAVADFFKTLATLRTALALLPAEDPARAAR
jgi:outer membrane protein TolC